MRAAIVEQPGGPEVLLIKEIPVPSPRPGWVLIRVKAFGLNRSEMYTRQGHSPNVRFPRVLGIECVGVVEDAGGTSLAPGQKVAAVMGEMGRAYDGGYAEYTLVPASQVMPLTEANGTAALQGIVDGVAAGRYRAAQHRVFQLDEIVAAHRYMEENRGTGKLVVVT